MATSSLVMLTKIWSSALLSDLFEIVLVMTLLSWVAASFSADLFGLLVYLMLPSLLLTEVTAFSLLGLAAFAGFSTSYCTENMSLCWMQWVSAWMAISEVNTSF